MNDKTITFIGGGNMAASLIGGLIADDCKPQTIWVSDPDAVKLEALEEDFGVNTSADNALAAAQGETVVFAVKPQIMAEAAKSLGPALKERTPLVVSIAAGVREPAIRGWLGFDAAIIRAMPNTPALVRSGATALYSNPFASDDQRNQAESILRAVGITLWVNDEAQLDAVTAVSGSGPAYAFLLMELMEQAGVRLGLARETAQLLAVQTVFGAAKMALESPEEPGVLRARVTSPGGTTERALQILDQGDIQSLFLRALQGANDRAAELGDILGDA